MTHNGKSPDDHSANGDPHARNGTPIIGADDPFKFTDEQFGQLMDLVANVSFSRQEWLRKSMGGSDRRRNVYEEVGYPLSSLSAEEYWDLYRRESLAARVCEVFPKEVWKHPPTVYEDEDPDTVTDFEAGWDALGAGLRGEESWYKKEDGSVIWGYCRLVDVLSRVNRYGVMLLGFDDVTGPGGLSRPVRRSKNRKLNFISCFPEALAPINTRVTDRNDPRYGQPLTYSVTFEDPQGNSGGSAALGSVTETVHWTRCVHVPSNVTTSKVFGEPEMESVLNEILGDQKIAHSNPEAFWKSCFALLVFETLPQLGTGVRVNKEDQRRMMEQVMNGLQRWIGTTGQTVKSLPPTITDPTPHHALQVERICIRKHIPVRIFKGSERGELASSNDEIEWADDVDGLKHERGTNQVIIPLVDRLVWAGVLPEPKEYHVEWPKSRVKSESERADIAGKRTEVLAKYVQGGVDALIPPMDFLTRELDFTEEEAATILENAADHVEEKKEEALADQEEQAAAQMGQQEQAMARGILQPQKTSTKAAPFEPAGNAFCPTGQGGGVDPSCGKGKSVSDGGGTDPIDMEDLASKKIKFLGEMITPDLIDNDLIPGDPIPDREGSKGVRLKNDLIVYHGGPKNLQEIRPVHGKFHDSEEKLVNFGDKEIAQGWVEMHGGEIYKVTIPAGTEVYQGMDGASHVVVYGRSWTPERVTANAAKTKLTGGRWITTEDGHHVYLKGGQAVAGNPHVVKSMNKPEDGPARQVGKPESARDDTPPGKTPGVTPTRPKEQTAPGSTPQATKKSGPDKPPTEPTPQAKDRLGKASEGHAEFKSKWASTPESRAGDPTTRPDKPAVVTKDLGPGNAIYEANAGLGSPEYKALQKEVKARQQDWIKNGTPAQKKTAEFASKWTHAGDKQRAEVMADKSYHDHVRTNSETTEVDLHRGVEFKGARGKKLKDLLMNAKPGDELPELGIAAFSEEKSWADHFRKGDGVVIKVAAGKGRSLPVAHVSNSPAELEHIMSGKFKVVSRTTEDVHYGNKKVTTKPRTVIEIEQVE